MDAAALTCAGTTAFRAVKVSRLAAGELVAVFGVGGLEPGPPGGRVALPARGALTVPLFDAVTGSIAGTRRDTADVFALHAAGRTCVVAETCLAELRAGEIPARVVLDLGASLWTL
ncbi:hypothetical protein [Amycolatopsis thermoflava]|uniref:hypothetical protein n=1 Tax=Amycolatopsis thermoflava TaxID=84480 RepID=UPI0037F6F286